MNGRTRGAITLLIAAAALTVAGLASATWASAAEDRHDRREQRRAEHAVAGRLPDPVAGRAEPVPRVEPARRQGRARHLGGHASEHERAVGRSAEPRRAGQLGRGRLLPDAGRQEGPVLREPGGAAGSLRSGRHLLHAPQPAQARGWSRSGSSARRPARTARSTSRARRGWTSATRCAGRSTSTSRAARRRRRPGRDLRQRAAERRPLRAGDPRHRAERRDGERHPAERARGRARGRVLLEPRRDARRPGHLGRDTRESLERPVVDAGQPRPGRQHGRSASHDRRSRGTASSSCSGAHPGPRGAATST